jgi:hypothetical protein
LPILKFKWVHTVCMHQWCIDMWSAWDLFIFLLFKKMLNLFLYRELDEPHLLFLKQKMTTSTVSQIINCLLWWSNDDIKRRLPPNVKIFSEAVL